MFLCTGCGLCCQNISNIKELLEFDLGNETCKYYNGIDNSCTIYEDRSQICRVDEMYHLKYNKYFSIEKFYLENAKVYNGLQKSINSTKVLE